jgi:phosphoribosylformylglycinamidine (FGAM) synthase-like enzyme
VAMWHQVSCFVVSCEMVWTSVLPSPVVAGFSIVEDRKVGKPTYSQTAERVFDARRNKCEALVQLRGRRSTVRLA